MKEKKVVIPVPAIVLFVAWFAYRPERLFINHRVNEAFPAAKRSSSVQTLASGIFHGVLHPAEGTATIYRLGDGSRVLRFTNFRTSNGSDFHVYMVAENHAKDSASVTRARFIDLESLKGSIGDQNYTLGPDVDLSKYRTVSVRCKRFSVNFGAAALTPDHLISRK